MIHQKIFAILIAIISLLPLPALSQDNDYVINNVIANGTGESPQAARINALNSAQKNAFLILVNRLAIDPNIVESLDDTAISDMVGSRQILNEKIAGNNYSATLNLAFSKSFVDYYLDEHLSSIKKHKNLKTSNFSGSYLVIPVKFTKDNQTLLWEKTNDWKQSWERILKNNNIEYLKIPKGTIDEINLINADNIINVNYDDLEPIISKYQMQGSLIPYFDFDPIENKVNIIIVNFKRFNMTQTKLSFVNINQLSSQELVEKVAKKTINYIALVNNKTSSSFSNKVSNYDIDILIDDLDDWLEVKNILQQTKLVSSFKVRSIAVDRVKIKISYNHNNGNIISAFKQNGLTLRQEKEDKFLLYY